MGQASQPLTWPWHPPPSSRWSQEEPTLPQDSQRPRGPATLSLTLDLSIPEPQLELSGRHVLLGSTRAP